MSRYLRTFGMRREPRVDGVLEWSRSEEGSIEFEGEITKFGDWIIHNNEIENAVLNTEKLLWNSTQSLAIRSESGEYLFVLSEPVNETYQFPFPTSFTYSSSFFGKLMKLIFIMSGVYLAFVLWSLITNFVLT